MAYNRIINGTDEPVLRTWDTSFSPTQGGQSSREYTAANLNKLSAQAQMFAANGWTGRLSYGAGSATLSVNCATTTFPGGGTSPFSDLTDKWEVGVDAERPDLCENPNFIYSCNAYDTPTGVNISQQILQHVRTTAASGKATWHDFWKTARIAGLTNPNGTPLLYTGGLQATVADYLILIGNNFPTQYANFRLFVNDYLRGATNFARDKYILKHTTLAPNTYAANVADFNVRKIYTISQLLSEAQSTSLWILPLPAYLAYRIANYPAPSPIPANYQFGALKSGSPAVNTAAGRIEISTEYLIDAWPIHTYGLAS